MQVLLHRRELELRSIIGVLDLVALRQHEWRDLGHASKGVKDNPYWQPHPLCQNRCFSERGHTRPEQQIDN